MKKLLLTAVCAIAVSVGAHADSVALYTFTGLSLTSSDTNTDSAASAITNGAGLPAAAANGTYGNPAPGIATDASAITATNQTTAISGNSYYSFTLTPNLGTPLSLGSLSFDYANFTTAGAFPTENFFARSSVDSFAANLAPAVTAAVASAGAFATSTVDLSGASFQGLTTPVEFRIYLYDGTSTSGKGSVVDNINVTAAPEPGSYVMLVSAAGLLGLVCRRNKVRS